MGKRDKKQENTEAENEIAGYGQGREVEFAGDLDTGAEEQEQADHPTSPANEAS